MQITSNFKSEEFRCPHCGIDNISLRLVHKLQEVRDVFGPMSISSGVRCVDHNRSVGGVADSAHVPAQTDEGVVGQAVDIVCVDSAKRFQLLALLGSRFKRIGIGASFIHVDTDERKPQSVCWTYYEAEHQA